MKKSLSLVLALVFVLGIAGTAFAANPFVDVPAKHWAYGAVSQLAKAGIVDGYDDNTFRGDKTMTRYEMAQVVAKAMAKSDKADAANKALIEKLSAEFSAELDNLGVRVSNLEKNQPNLKFTGNFDMRYTATTQDNNTASSVKAQYRARVEGLAKVDEDTTFGMRFVNSAVSTNNFRNNTWTAFGADGVAAKDNAITIDRAFVTRKTGVFNTTVGRQSLAWDPANLAMDPGAFSFDGVKTAWTMGDFNVNVKYGRFTNGVTLADSHYFYNNDVDYAKFANSDIYGAYVGSKAGKLAYSMGYDVIKGGTTATVARDTIGQFWNVFADYTFDSKFSLQAEYLKNSHFDTDNSLYSVKAIYGDKAITKAGQQNLAVWYYKAGKNAYVPAFTTADDIKSATVYQNNYKNLTFIYNYGFSKNFSAELNYVKVSDNEDSYNDYNYTRVLLHSKF